MTSSLATEHTARRSRPLTALFGLVVVALVARFAFLAWEPPFDPEAGLRYDELRAVAGLYWPANLYVGGPAFLVTWLGTAAFLAILGRGRVLVRIGSVLVAAGGIVFSFVIVGSQIAVGLGVALGLICILVVRSTPRWFPIVGLAYVVAFFALPIDQLGSGAVLVNETVQAAVLAGIGWFALHRQV